MVSNSMESYLMMLGSTSGNYNCDKVRSGRDSWGEWDEEWGGGKPVKLRWMVGGGGGLWWFPGPCQ